jgi:hypothetical protein
VTAALFVEALDTLFVVCRALLAWIAAGAFVLTACLFTAIAVIAQSVKTARRMLRAPSWAHSRYSARKFTRTHTRPPRGHTEPRTYREAA